MSASASDAVSVQDYVAGRLSQSECEAFEARLSNDADLVLDLEESLRIREGLEMLSERGVLESLRQPPLRAPFAGMRWAAAAAVLVIAVFAALYWGGRYVGDRSPLVAVSVGALRGGSGSAPTVVERYSFAAMREATSTPQLALPKSGVLELRALTSVTDASRTFRVALSKMGDQKPSAVGSVEHVVPDADGFVAIYADVSRLAPGDYGLMVEPEGAGNETKGERFEFKLKGIRD